MSHAAGGARASAPIGSFHSEVSPALAESSFTGFPHDAASEDHLNVPPNPLPLGGVPLLERIRRATLGRFDVMTALGEGGMATVFLARDLALDRQVAIKVMNPALMSSPAALGRFRREARIAAALDHPHIISIFAVGEDAELAFYVMRYVEGRSLHDLIREEGAQTFRRVEGIIADIGQALHYAHRRGVIHRDVKPANIMLDQDDWLFVTDFGIAKLDEVDRLTLSGHVFGTPHYMSPEYYNGGLIGSASDQYALGVVSYELLTGTPPYPGDTIGEVMRGHLFDPIPPLRSIRPDLPEAVEHCVHRMLQKDAALRFPTVADAVASFKAAGRSGESGVITEIIDTPSRSPLVMPRTSGAAERQRKPMTWPMRLTLAVGGAATLGTALILVNSILSARDLEPMGGPVPAANVGAPPSGAPNGASTTASDGKVATPERGAPAPQPVTPTVSSRSAAIPPASVARESAPAPVTGPPGAIRIGSRIPLTVLYLNGRSFGLLGEGTQTVDAGPGPVRVRISAKDCASWDTTLTVRSRDTTVVGYRSPRCKE
jgi:serine/threonine protein kinase